MQEYTGKQTSQNNVKKIYLGQILPKIWQCIWDQKYFTIYNKQLKK